MLDQHGREILIQEYKSDLKDASRQHRRIAKKKYQIEKNGRLETIDDRTAEDIKEQSIYAEIISSTKYALYWLEHGIERPLDEEAAKKIPKYRRAKHITNMDKISYEIYCNQYESARNYPITEEKQEMLIQLKELLSTFSERERDLFDYIHNQQLTYAEAAEKMDIKVGTAKSMSQRIRNKIDAYLEYGHQISLF